MNHHMARGMMMLFSVLPGQVPPVPDWLKPRCGECDMTAITLSQARLAPTNSSNSNGSSSANNSRTSPPPTTSTVPTGPLPASLPLAANQTTHRGVIIFVAIAGSVAVALAVVVLLGQWVLKRKRRTAGSSAIALPPTAAAASIIPASGVAPGAAQASSLEEQRLLDAHHTEILRYAQKQYDDIEQPSVMRSTDKKWYGSNE